MKKLILILFVFISVGAKAQLGNFYYSYNGGCIKDPNQSLCVDLVIKCNGFPDQTTIVTDQASAENACALRHRYTYPGCALSGAGILGDVSEYKLGARIYRFVSCTVYTNYSTWAYTFSLIDGKAYVVHISNGFIDYIAQCYP